MLRGEVYFVNLNPVIGREQYGTRPVVVVSSDRVNRQPLVVLIVPGTDGQRVALDYDTNVRVPAGEGGLAKETVFMCFQARALDRSRFVSGPIGVLDASWMQEIDEALRYSFEV